jgi:hypothetical protein
MIRMGVTDNDPIYPVVLVELRKPALADAGIDQHGFRAGD